MPTRHKRRKHHPVPQTDRSAYEIRRKRGFVDRFGAWEECGRWACWRARRCRDATVACFTEQREGVVDMVAEEALEDLRLVGIPDDLLPGLEELREGPGR